MRRIHNGSVTSSEASCMDPAEVTCNELPDCFQPDVTTISNMIPLEEDAGVRLAVTPNDCAIVAIVIDNGEQVYRSEYTSENGTFCSPLFDLQAINRIDVCVQNPISAERVNCQRVWPN